VEEIATVPMNEPDGGINLAIFSGDGFLMNDPQAKVLQNSHHHQKLCQSPSLQCSALELTDNLWGTSNPMSAMVLFRLVRWLPLI
jgi:hypothetical protein